MDDWQTSQLPIGLISTALIEENFCQIAVVKIGALCGEGLIKEIVVVFNAVCRQIVIPFPTIVYSHHGMWRRNVNTAAHTIMRDATEKVKDVRLHIRLG